MANIINGFISSVIKFPKRIALVVESIEMTYEQLFRASASISSVIKQNLPSYGSLIAILSHKTLISYSSVLGVLLSGNAYVPLSPKFSVEKLKNILDISGIKVIIVDKKYIKKFRDLLPLLDDHFIFIFPDGNFDFRNDLHKFVFVNGIRSPFFPEPFDLHGSSPAYLLFTSGSTSMPKSILISHENLVSYVNYISNRGRINENDRFSQLFDLSFDPSVHDMFVCWNRGASLYCVPDDSFRVPTRFFVDHKITTCFIVPSLVEVMNKEKSLNKNIFPLLRYCIFCGAPLRVETARLWQEAAPNAIVENLYGPTEATVAITGYTWTEKSIDECYNGIVPIGWMFDGQKSCIVNEKLEVVDNESGELCLSGSQVTLSYFNDPERTKKQYIEINGDIWYRTGDFVKKDKRRCLYFLGRTDGQIKINGHMVELQAVDYVITKIVNGDMVASICYKENGVNKIVSFVCSKKILTEEEILSYCIKELPDFMVPKKICFIDEMPLNCNGKIDRFRLKKMIG